MKFTIYQESRIGRRKSNQDRLAYCYSRDALMMVVADGMGGHLHGDVAAQIAVEYITRAFQQTARTQVADATVFLSRALTNAHHAILDYAFDKFLPEAPRTTIVACLIQDHTAWWAHAGDSRLYLVRDGHILTRTKDHSRVQTMVDQGLLDAEEAARHPERNRIYSCLGGSHAPQIEFSTPVRLHDNDVLMLCTDGVWGPLTSADLQGAVVGASVADATSHLLDVAEHRAGASSDNLSLLTMQWHNELAQAQDQPSTVSTQAMEADSFTTQLAAFGNTFNPGGSADFSEDEIEKTIAEINAAIHKFST